MEQRYQITLYSQMGPREGTLSLHEDSGSVWGTLSLAGYENEVRGVRAENGLLTLTHSLRTAVGGHACRSVLRLEGDALSGTAELSGYKMRWSGKRLSGEQTKGASL